MGHGPLRLGGPRVVKPVPAMGIGSPLCPALTARLPRQGRVLVFA